MEGTQEDTIAFTEVDDNLKREFKLLDLRIYSQCLQIIHGNAHAANEESFPFFQIPLNDETQCKIDKIKEVYHRKGAKVNDPEIELTLIGTGSKLHSIDLGALKIKKLTISKSITRGRACLYYKNRKQRH